MLLKSDIIKNSIESKYREKKLKTKDIETEKPKHRKKKT